MILHLYIIGTLFVLLALLHVGFPRYFNWKTELASLSLINRQMMHIHALFIAVVVMLMGLLCLTSAHELVSTPLGRRIAFFLGIFWAFRLLVQLFGYSRQLWNGKRLETGVHVLFILLWSYVSAVFFWVAF